MAASREGVPFPSFIEAFIMIVAFEILREAGVRMPRAVGQAVSIVGALILGEAAVNAGIASDILIIVVALTAITSFIITKITDATIFIRFALLISANILGIMGITLVLFVIVAHMCSLRSFGVPYMSPLAPLSTKDLKDSYVRFPLWSMITRPRTIIWGNRDRMKNRLEK
jgi:spore germination protein KA